MATIKPTTVPSKRLAESITSSSSSFKVNNIAGWDGSDLTSASFGTVAYVVFRNSAGTAMEIMQIDPSTVTSASSAITITARGLNFDGTLATEVSANKLSWVKGDTIVEFGTDVPQLLKHSVTIIDDQTVAGVKTFSSVPITSGGDPTSDNQLARKAYVDAAALGTVTLTPVVVPGNAGATLAIDQLVYKDPSDQEWKLCDADTAGSVENVQLGITRGAGTDGNPITDGVHVLGRHTASSAIFTAGKVFASNTAGAFSNSAGTTEVSLGIADSTTVIDFFPRYDQKITEDIQDALAGTSGTAPSNSNKFVDAADVSDAAVSGKIVRATGTALPALSAENLTNLPILNVQTFTSNDTWTKPSGATAVEVFLLGAGGGGGSGSRTAGTGADGGSGGGGGALVRKSFLASALGATEAVVIGTGGAGGAAVSTTANGNNGSAGTASTFGTNLLSASGGSGGLGGNGDQNGGAGGVVTNGDLTQVGGAGGDANSAAAGDTGVDTSAVMSPRGGGGGGGFASGSGNGGAGGSFTGSYVKAGGAANTAGSATAAGLFWGGVGGGGGNGSQSGTAQAGGAGGNYGGGGGGGGGKASGAGSSGAGGAGANGVCVVVTYF